MSLETDRMRVAVISAKTHLEAASAALERTKKLLSNLVVPIDLENLQEAALNARKFCAKLEILEKRIPK